MVFNGFFKQIVTAKLKEVNSYLFGMNAMQMILFLKDIAIAGGFMIIIAYGPGKISLDNYFESSQEWDRLIKKNQKIFTNFLNLN